MYMTVHSKKTFQFARLTIVWNGEYTYLLRATSLVTQQWCSKSKRNRTVCQENHMLCIGRDTSCAWRGRRHPPAASVRCSTTHSPSLSQARGAFR